MDKHEQRDILKFVDPHVASELRNLPSDPTAIDPATLKRLREHLSYHSAMLSVRDSVKYVYVREVLRHANQEVVKLNKTAAKEKLTLDKQLWTDFIRDKKANGTSPIVRRLLLKRNESIEDFSESMVWIYNFAYDWLNFFRRVHRNETIDPVKHEWPFTKKHLDVVNIFRESLKQDPLDMVWLDEEKKLVLPQMLVVKTMVPGSRGSWEDLGLHPAKNV